MSNSKPTQPFGRYGEQLVVDYLKNAGYQIVDTNWRCAHGEIDIIAKTANTLVFVEVRSRHAENTEASFESVNKRKQAKITASANAYLDDHQLEDMDWRVDLIGVAVPRSGKPIIDHVEDALGW